MRYHLQPYSEIAGYFITNDKECIVAVITNEIPKDQAFKIADLILKELSVPLIPTQGQGVYRIRKYWEFKKEMTEIFAVWTGEYWRFVKHSKGDTGTRIPNDQIVEILNFMSEKELG